MTLKLKTILCAALAGFAATQAQASVLFSFEEVGADVVATISGDFVVGTVDAFSAGDNLAGDSTGLLSESLFADLGNRFRHSSFGGTATATTLQLAPDKVWGGVSDIGFDGSTVQFAWVGASAAAQVYTGGETVNVAGGTFTWTGKTLNDVFSDGGASLLSGGRAYDFANIGTVSTNYINYTVVPEPSTYALMGGLLALSYVMVRRRK